MIFRLIKNEGVASYGTSGNTEACWQAPANQLIENFSVYIFLGNCSYAHNIHIDIWRGAL